MGGLPGDSLYGLAPRLEHTVQVSVFKAGGDEGSRLAERAFLVASSPEYAPTCRTHPLPGAHPYPQSLILSQIIPLPGPSGCGLLPGILSETHNHRLPSWGPSGKACPLRQRRSCPSLAGPVLRPGWGPKRGLLGLGQVTFRRKVLGLGPLFLGPYSSRSLSLQSRNAKKYESLPGPHSPVQPAFPASLHGAPPRRTASPTHFCSKAAMSLESRMFSSGSQVLYLPSHACRKAK